MTAKQFQSVGRLGFKMNWIRHERQQVPKNNGPDYTQKCVHKADSLCFSAFRRGGRVFTPDFFPVCWAATFLRPIAAGRQHRTRLLKVSHLSVVTLDYSVSDESGDVLDSTEGREPLVYLHGAGFLVPGLEKPLYDREIGDSFELDVAAAEAYGEYEDDLVQSVPMNCLTAWKWLEVTPSLPIPMMVTVR